MRSAEERITVKDGLSHLKYPFFKPKQTIKVQNVTCVWWMWKGWRRLEKSAMEAAFLWWGNLRWPLFRLMMLHRDYMKWLLELLPKVSGTDVVCVCDKKHARCIQTRTITGRFSRLLSFMSAVVQVNVGKYSHKWIQGYWRCGKFSEMQQCEGRGRILITKQEIPGCCLGS